ncbi:MAG: hypothetical protein N4A31_01150 [Rickettsiales bacterium]|jgi:hypothetical protein|nr:hypothetical protein [Rickettsiales bacterium]
MTSTITTTLNLNITATEISQEAFDAIPSSIEKASMIDLPAYLIFAPENAVYNSMIAGISYDIRTTINEIGKKAFNIDDTSSKIMLATTSGGIGGAFKYSVIGQNPAIGAISTTGYELCGAIDFCNDNPLVYGPVTIAIESFDAAAHAYLKAEEGNIYGAVIAGAIGGAKVGATVYGLIQSLLIPVTEAIHKAESIDLNTTINDGNNITYAGDIDHHAEL